jgi:hypothetical protein
VQLFLRIYAIAYLLLFVESVLFTGLRGIQPSIIDMIDMMVFTPVAVLALWSAAFRHINLPGKSWKILLFASVFWRPLAVGYSVLSGDAVSRFQRFMGGVTVGMSADNALAVTLLAMVGLCLAGSMVVIPPLVALYRNAYGNESLLKLMSPAHLRGDITPKPRSKLDERVRMEEVAALRAANRQKIEI